MKPNVEKTEEIRDGIKRLMLENFFVNDLGEAVCMNKAYFMQEIDKILQKELLPYLQDNEAVLKNVLDILHNIRRFDDKENGADYFAGWDGALDTVEMDIKEFLAEKVERKPTMSENMKEKISDVLDNRSLTNRRMIVDGLESLIQQEIEGFVEYLDQKTSDKKHKFINEVTGEETTLQVADIKDIRKFLGEYLDQRKGKNETH